MARLKIKRGEIWTADLRPGKGHEITKIRPIVIVSSDAINKISPTILALPISSQIPPVIGYDRVLITQNDVRMIKNDSVVVCGHIRTLDKSRVKKRIGVLPREKIQEIEEALKLVLDLS